MPFTSFRPFCIVHINLSSFFYIQFVFFVVCDVIAKQSIKAVECAGINQSVLFSWLIVTKRILFATGNHENVSSSMQLSALISIGSIGQSAKLLNHFAEPFLDISIQIETKRKEKKQLTEPVDQ
jgi:hypothetical protein